MQNSEAQPNKPWIRWRPGGLTIFAGAIAVAVACAAIAGNHASESEQPDFTTESVKQGRFTKTVGMTGDVRTFQPTIVFNNCRYWPLRIVELVPEGTWVEEGDFICQLDCSVLQDRLNEQRIQLIRAKAGLATAEVRESLQQFTNDRRLARNNSQLALAREKLATFEFGESINAVNQLKDEELVKEDLLDAAQEAYAQSEFLTALGYNSSAQFNVSKARLGTARSAYDQASRMLNLTEQFKHPRELFDLQSQYELAQQELHRSELQNTLGEAGVRLTKLEMQRWLASVESYVDYLTRSIEACTIVAPASGELVHCHKQDEGKFIEVGSFVHHTQDIVRICDRSRMIFAGRVQDTRVYEISTGLPAVIDVLNVTGHEYKGTLSWIAPIPSPASWFVPEDMYHPVQIILDDDPEALELIALGATAHAEVIVDDREDVLTIPTRAVFSHSDGYSVIVQQVNGIRRQTVELGVSNDVRVEVLSGLRPGEQVVIDSPHVLRRLAASLR